VYSSEQLALLGVCKVCPEGQVKYCHTIPTLLLQGHSSTVNHLDWSSDGLFVQSASIDYELLYCIHSFKNLDALLDFPT
jgi:hypothetical protein